MDLTATPLFRMEGISKRYGGVRALEKAELTVHAGRVHAILGENGAGKSTLIKIMAGVVQADEGRMMLAGSEVRFARPAEANAAGIACIFQELSLIPDLQVADNIAISDPPNGKRQPLFNSARSNPVAARHNASIGGEYALTSLALSPPPGNSLRVITMIGNSKKFQ